MDFIIILSALLLNVLTAHIFKPYTKWFVGIFKDIAVALSKKKYKTMRKAGAWIVWVLGLTIFVSAWLVTDLLSQSSQIYRYIIYIVTVYFCVSAGQIMGFALKLANNTENTVFSAELYKELLSSEINVNDDPQRKRMLIESFSRLISERVVSPLLYIVFLGPGGCLAYTFINTAAMSDKHPEIKAHGFADAAIGLNRVLSVPGYWASGILMGVVGWIFGIKTNCKGIRLNRRCEKYVAELYQKVSDEGFFRRVALVTCVCALISAFAVLCIYIFITAVLAGAGLGEYLNFWNKDAN